MTTAPLLDAAARHPITLPNGEVHKQTVHLNRVIDHPNIEIGDYSYYSDFEPVTDYAARLAPYLFPGAPERLVIGRFAQIAHGARFITSSANHPMAGFSTYPFSIFRPETMMDYVDEVARHGDTVVGHDVWFGYSSTVLPGVRIGNGVIVGACSVVSRDVPDYAVVAGNPARIVRMRFPRETIERLNRIAWWNWDIGTIRRHLPALRLADSEALARMETG